MINLQQVELLRKCLNSRSVMPIIELVPKDERIDFINLLTPIDLVNVFILSPNPKQVEVNPAIDAMLAANFQANEIAQIKNIVVDANMAELNLIQVLGYCKWDEVKYILNTHYPDLIFQMPPTLKNFLEKV